MNLWRLAAVLALTAGTPALAADLYVAPNGSDTWSGKQVAPNRRRTDGPFATLTRARDEIRARKAAGALSGETTVWVRGGVYSLPETLKLGPEDSGTAEAPVTYRAYRNEKPVLLGGRQLTGFTPYKGKILKADVNAQGFQGIYFRQLFFNGKRQHLARFPNFDPRNPYGGGWSYVDGKPIPMYAEVPGEDKRTLRFKPADVHEWARPEEGEVMVFPRYNWWNSIVRIASIDREKNTMTLAGDAAYEIRPSDRYYVRNLFEELDSPGEWYLDRRTGTLYFWPPASMRRASVYAPTLERILEIGPGAAYLTFRGFTIECCDGTAISIRDSEHCLIAGSTIRNVGGRCDPSLSAVSINGGKENGAVGNDIYEVGSNAIGLYGGDRKTLTPAGLYADNNYIHHTGVFYKQGVGVSVSGVGNRVSHNLIHDCPRFGILFSGNDQILEYNHIRHVDLETADTGAVYTGGRDWVTSRGTVIRYNYFHDILGYGQERGRWISPHYAWGIYLDDNAAGIDVVGNIVARTVRGLVHLHNGRDNRIENNILIDGKLQQVEMNGWRHGSAPLTTHLPTMLQGYETYANLPAWSKYRGLRGNPPDKATPMAGNKFLRNIVYYGDPDALLYKPSRLPYDQYESDYNLIYHFGKPLQTNLPSVPAEQQWEEWRKLGFEQHSLVADPLFVNPKKDDYRLRPDSPAFQLGFQPIPVEKIGPYKDPLRASWPIIEAEGAREKPLVSEAPAPEMKPAPRNTTPVVTRKAVNPVTVDGEIAPDEWPAAKLTVRDAPDRVPTAGDPCTARVCYDDQYLYVTVSVPVSEAAKLRLGDAWGKNDGAEVCFQDLSGAKPGPTFVIHGFAAGRHESSTEAGASAEQAAAVGAQTRFAAKVAAKQWTGEWAIPFAAAGITPRPGVKLAFNLGLLRSETGEWIQWVGTQAQTWRLDSAGYLVLE